MLESLAWTAVSGILTQIEIDNFRAVTLGATLMLGIILVLLIFVYSSHDAHFPMVVWMEQTCNSKLYTGTAVVLV